MFTFIQTIISNYNSHIILKYFMNKLVFGSFRASQQFSKLNRIQNWKLPEVIPIDENYTNDIK